ncbi:GNAT family N-acetyltransferase [Facklamia lactis]|nr:GNAT family N-acetyltransferase [Facklamia lactis]
MEFKDDDKRIYVVNEAGQEMGQMIYENHDDHNRIHVTHTFTNKEFQGQGLAGKLLDQMVKKAEKENKKITTTCSYVERKFDQESEKYQHVMG